MTIFCDFVCDFLFSCSFIQFILVALGISLFIFHVVDLRLMSSGFSSLDLEMSSVKIEKRMGKTTSPSGTPASVVSYVESFRINYTPVLLSSINLI